MTQISMNKFGNKFTQGRFVFLMYFLLSLLFFFQFPLQNSLVGDIDTIYNLALYHQIKNFIDLHLFGIPTGLLCAPTDFTFQEQAWINFGANYGIGFFHVFLNYLGIPDLWAHWLFMATLFAFNCYSLYLLLNHIFKNKIAAIAVALIFNFAHFTLANLDNINSVVFFSSYFALYFYMVYVDNLADKKKHKYFYWAVIIGAIQIYLSPYNFVIHTLIWVVFIIFYEFKHINKATIARFAIGFVIYTAIIFPYLYVFFISDLVSREYNVYTTKDFIHIQSLNFDDLGRVLKNHLYLTSELIFDSPLLTKLRAAYLGIVLYLLAIIGLFKKQNRALGLTIFIVGMVVAIGPFVTFHNVKLFPSFIMHPIYEILDLYDTISVPIRFFFIALFGLCILAGNGLILIYDKRKSIVLPVIFVSLVLIENVPLKMEVYDHNFILNPSKIVIDELHKGNNELVYNMPSSLIEINSNYRREYIYMYWQHLHKQNVVNCFPPFMPGSRKEIDNQLVEFNAKNLYKVIQENGIDKIAFHKRLAFEDSEKQQLDSLYNFTFLMPIIESKETIIFKVRTNQ